MIVLSGLLFVLIVTILIVFYQVSHRPIPSFKAVSVDGQSMVLTPFILPNLSSSTLLRFASQATVSAYTFDFLNYAAELESAKRYFTDAGWNDFSHAISGTLKTVIKNQLFITAVVSGAPVIVNEGPLPGKGYVWRLQIPFLVTYQSANSVSTASYVVILSIIRVPTTINPQGIGVDQFIMASPYG